MPIPTRPPSVAVMKTNLPRTRLHKHMEKSEREEDTRGQVVGVYSGFAWKHKAWPVSLRISIPFVFAYFYLRILLSEEKLKYADNADMLFLCSCLYPGMDMNYLPHD